ncbi:hypothetical protein [Aureimonas populi]|uniref:Lipoprotein n=1 Tax=Aureimonas populi TaxID=1701758 RepID=A0ABW5CRA1_9HYPH|nr:hypothetical protein [Aureimonas populi]
MSLRAIASMVLLVFLAGCAGRAPEPVATQAGDTGLDRMERLTLAANRCWFRSGDPAFARYSLAPELSSFSGRPRFLVVPKNRPEERPLLVVEGRTGTPDVSTYGPLLQGETAARIRRDIDRWSAGGETCA